MKLVISYARTTMSIFILLIILCYTDTSLANPVFHPDAIEFRGTGCKTALSVTDVTLNADGSLHIDLKNLKPAQAIHERQDCTIILPFTTDSDSIIGELTLKGSYVTPNLEKILTIVRLSLSGTLGLGHTNKIFNSSEGEFLWEYPFSTRSIPNEVSELKVLLSAVIGNPSESPVRGGISQDENAAARLFFATSALTVKLIGTAYNHQLK